MECLGMAEILQYYLDWLNPAVAIKPLGRSIHVQYKYGTLRRYGNRMCGCFHGWKLGIRSLVWNRKDWLYFHYFHYFH